MSSTPVDLPTPPTEIPLIVPAVPVDGVDCDVALSRYKVRYAESISDPDGFWMSKFVIYISFT